MICKVASWAVNEFDSLVFTGKELSTGEQQRWVAVHMHSNTSSGNVAPIFLLLSSAEAAEIWPYPIKHTGSVQYRAKLQGCFPQTLGLTFKSAKPGACAPQPNWQALFCCLLLAVENQSSNQGNENLRHLHLLQQKLNNVHTSFQ